ncbi:MAG TPA: hypothetical protein VJ717_03225 [Gemmatimonadaceae bacterium]|nr:hypothetical protein [Gemmatimonadaceae bacterium]
MRTIIASVGGTDGDTALAALLTERLARDAPIAAARVVVEDLSGDPTDVAQRLEDEWPRFDRVIFVGAVARDRPAGTVAAYRWDGDASSPAEADEYAPFDTMLLAVRQLVDVPDEVIIVELEPDDHDGVRHMSPAVVAGLERACILSRRFATNGSVAADLPRAALGAVRGSLP